MGTRKQHAGLIGLFFVAATGCALMAFGQGGGYRPIGLKADGNLTGTFGGYTASQYTLDTEAAAAYQPTNANLTDIGQQAAAYYLNRTNHTGHQSAGTLVAGTTLPAVDGNALTNLPAELTRDSELTNTVWTALAATNAIITGTLNMDGGDGSAYLKWNVSGDPVNPDAYIYYSGAGNGYTIAAPSNHIQILPMSGGGVYIGNSGLPAAPTSTLQVKGTIGGDGVNITNITRDADMSFVWNRPTNAVDNIEWFYCAKRAVTMQRVMGKTRAGSVTFSLVEQLTNDSWTACTTNYLDVTVGTGGTAPTDYTSFTDATLDQWKWIGIQITNATALSATQMVITVHATCTY